MFADASASGLYTIAHLHRRWRRFHVCLRLPVMANVGDTVTLRAPRGLERLEIIAVRYDDLRWRCRLPKR